VYKNEPDHGLVGLKHVVRWDKTWNDWWNDSDTKIYTIYDIQHMPQYKTEYFLLDAGVKTPS
jgi:hypothetical protein